MSFVKAAFSNAPDVLADFGVTPRKAPAPATQGNGAQKS